LGAKLLDVQNSGRQFVDRYELVGEIASGGMATVFLARLTGVGGFQRMYAIKRLHPHLQNEKEFVEMFLDEARLAAGIHHPNVVPILEVGASQNAYYLAMEYIEGETLARLLAKAASKKERLPVPQVLRMTLDTLSGLHAAHELRDESGGLAGVVHRDVSPQNVLVGADGVSRITDFGVARAATRLTATRVGQLKGKIAYMAPEQARGEEDLDRRADVFAAGIVFWEALAHRRLFKAQNEAGTLARVLHEPLPDLRELAPHVSKGVAEVVMKALERDRDKRISTCAEFADLLEKAAIASGELGSTRDVQNYMDSILGEDIRSQRDAVRQWTALADSQVGPAPQLTPTGGQSTPGVETLGNEELTGFSKNPKSKIGLIAILVLLAVGGFVGFRAMSGEAEAPVQTGAPVEVDADAQVEPPAPSVPEQPKEEESDALPLAEVIADEPEQPKEAPAPRPAPTRRNTAPAPAPSPSPAPAPAPRPRPKKKNPLDALDSNPYR
jgi:serine/threonine-protein kinase